MSPVEEMLCWLRKMSDGNRSQRVCDENATLGR